MPRRLNYFNDYERRQTVTCTRGAVSQIQVYFSTPFNGSQHFDYIFQPGASYYCLLNSLPIFPPA